MAKHKKQHNLQSRTAQNAQSSTAVKAGVNADYQEDKQNKLQHSGSNHASAIDLGDVYDTSFPDWSDDARDEDQDADPISYKTRRE